MSSINNIMKSLLQPIFLWALFLMFGLLLILPGNGVAEQEHRLPSTDNLIEAAQLARNEKLPILLMFSAEDCDYCIRLEDEELVPMTRNAENRKRVIIKKVLIDHYAPIVDFAGKEVDPADFAHQRGVRVTPTLQFIDPEGKELAPKMVGYQAGTFYGAYLDQAIDQSRAKLQ